MIALLLQLQLALSSRDLYTKMVREVSYYLSLPSAHFDVQSLLSLSMFVHLMLLASGMGLEFHVKVFVNIVWFESKIAILKFLGWKQRHLGGEISTLPEHDRLRDYTHI